jgi:hypothetical protein
MSAAEHSSTIEPAALPADYTRGLAEGRIVHFVLQDGQHRPAIVVRLWDKAAGTTNLQVFTDALNDGGVYASGLHWATSVLPDPAGEKPYSWHWPERAE